jgi:hypothetical protein
VKANHLQLTNTDFDTGRLTHAGEYKLTDKTYAHLLDQLAKNNFQNVAPDLRQNILTFYKAPHAPSATKSDRAAWSKTQEELERLKAVEPLSPASIQVVWENPK